MRYLGILFDKDGTLIEAHGVWAPLYRSVLMRLKGIGEDEANRYLADAGYDVALDRVIGGSLIAGGTTAQLVQLWWPDADSAEREQIIRTIDVSDKQAHSMIVTPIVELRPVLEGLRAAGYHIGIATNDSSSSTQRHVEQLGIGEVLDAIICADTVSVPKPSGNMIKAFADMTGLQPHEIIMVGDNHHDMEEAINGGAGYKVGVLSGNCVEGQLDHLADVVLAHIGELVAHLEQTNVL